MDDAFAFPVLEGTSVQPTASREDLVAAARAEADAITEAARVRGHEEGFAAGMAEARVQLEPVRNALTKACSGIERMADDVVPVVEQRAVELALVLAEKILATSLALDPSLVGAIATGALRRIVAHDRIELDVNPEDAELVRAALASDKNELSSSRRIDVIAERRVPRGGCVVRTVDGEIDARIEKQLERAAAILRETVAAAA
jgi:flagellar biosynthesis/type III secretory pathway protein FliH